MRRVFVAAAVGLVLLGACGRGDNPTVAGGGTTVAEGAEGDAGGSRNEADLTFAQGMIVHHQQAVEMADHVLERGEAADVKALAQRIKDAQSEEIDLIRGWLAEWGEEEAPADTPHGGGDGTDMKAKEEAGAKAKADMEALANAEGAELDKMFLEMMIPHHEQAIAMAETEVEEGEFADAIALAERIISDQRAEITEIQGLLAGRE